MKLFALIPFLCLFLLASCDSENTDPAVSTAEDNNDTEELAIESTLEEEIDKENEAELASDDTAVIAEETQAKPAAARGDYEVFLGGDVLETDDAIIIHGQSNILPKAKIVGRIIINDDQIFADTIEIIEEDGSFYMELPHPNIQDEIVVTATFHFDMHQEDAIVRHYGDRGQKLEGPYIYKHQRAAGGRSPRDIYQKAEVAASFVPSEEKAVRQFAEPIWHELPEDYGSPRVWIEVDEIHHDQEYFYLHGRSNLLEGSKIRGSYRHNRDETRVLPDGSFNLKIEYEYHEDTPFKIEFRPHDFQWNIVEEAYGKHGQKLVGELVVTNKFNNNQTIEKIVELQSNELYIPDNVDVEIDGSEITMLVPDHLLFDFNEYALKEAAKETLREVAKTLSSLNKEAIILISGHTDNIGNFDYNMELSRKRAEEVKDHLLSVNVPHLEINTEGHGETKPVASNDTEAGQAKNRRVEIFINLR